MAKVNPDYRKMVEQIKIDADNYADQQMQTTYKNQKDHLTELHKFIGLMYIKYATDGLLSKLTPQQRKAITGDVDSTLKSVAKDMGQTQVNNLTNILKRNYSDTYYKNAYVMDSGVKVDLKFDILKKEYIDAAVNNPIDGTLFSDRIWNNTATVADKLKQSIVDAMNGDTTIDAIGKDIQEIFNVNAYESQRLVNTENTRVQSQAIDDIGQSTGCNKQMYSATLEANTCAECGALDGQIFDIDDDSKPEIPEHPNCRCLYINVPFDNWQPTKRKDNETKDIIDYENYNTWLKNKGVDNNGNDDIIKETRDYIQSDKQPLIIEKGKQGKHILGDNNYIDGRSYLTITKQEAQELVNKYAGTGTFEFDRNGNVKKKELIIADKTIGVNIDNKTGEKSYTNRFYIHYSKKGTHIVPTLKGSDKK